MRRNSFFTASCNETEWGRNENPSQPASATLAGLVVVNLLGSFHPNHLINQPKWPPKRSERFTTALSPQRTLGAVRSNPTVSSGTVQRGSCAHVEEMRISFLRKH